MQDAWQKKMEKMRSRYIISLLLVFSVMTVFSAELYAVGAISVGDMLQRKNVRSMREIKDTNVIKQSLDFSCGPAGLATIMKYYFGEDTSEQDILETLLLTTDLEKVKERRGFSLLDLKEYVQRRGYKATGYRMDMDYLREVKRPVLVPIKFKDYRHFVVVKGVHGDRVFFADPAMGNLTMKTATFDSIWQNGIGLVVDPPDDMIVPDGAFALTEEEAQIIDYRSVKRDLSGTVIRTTVFPAEF